MLQWFIETQQTDDQHKKIADKIMLTNFAALDTSSLVRRSIICQRCTVTLTLDQSGSLSLIWLADHPQYIDPIRIEVEEIVTTQGWTKAALGKMWKLDSFLKEFQRYQGLGLGTHIMFLLVVEPLTPALTTRSLSRAEGDERHNTARRHCSSARHVDRCDDL